MRISHFLASCLSLPACIDARSVHGTTVVESLSGIPAGWHSTGAPSSNHRMLFRIALVSVSPRVPTYDDCRSMLGFEIQVAKFDKAACPGLRSRTDYHSLASRNFNKLSQTSQILHTSVMAAF